MRQWNGKKIQRIILSLKLIVERVSFRTESYQKNWCIDYLIFLFPFIRFDEFCWNNEIEKDCQCEIKLHLNFFGKIKSTRKRKYYLYQILLEQRRNFSIGLQMAFEFTSWRWIIYFQMENGMDPLNTNNEVL